MLLIIFSFNSNIERFYLFENLLIFISNYFIIIMLYLLQRMLYLPNCQQIPKNLVVSLITFFFRNIIIHILINEFQNILRFYLFEYLIIFIITYDWISSSSTKTSIEANYFGDNIVQGYRQKICLESAILDFPGRNLQQTA